MDVSERFIELTKIPRPSGHIGKMQEFLKDFAEKHNIYCEQDEAGNILMVRPGKTESVALQGHQDMVASKIPGKVFDFTKDPIEIIIDGTHIRANGTTLGADNGVGIAMMLNALDSDELKDVSLECLFTANEEVGLLGANRLKNNILKSKYLINLDMENENKITVGCAGAANIFSVFKPEIIPASGKWSLLKVTGLMSGHSSMAGFGRANAIKLAAGFLGKLDNIKISSIAGGTFNNVIPMECTVVFSTSDISAEKKLASYVNEISQKYHETDPNISITVSSAETPKTSFDSVTSGKLVSSLIACPNDLLGKSEKGITASSNLGVIKSDDKVEILCMARAAKDDLLAHHAESIRDTFLNSGADSDIQYLFPSWHEEEGSELQKISTSVYRRMYSREPQIEITHGGLECGVISNKCPGIQAIAIGPDMRGVHTPDEYLDVESLRRCEKFVFELVKELVRK